MNYHNPGFEFEEGHFQRGYFPGLEELAVEIRDDLGNLEDLERDPDGQSYLLGLFSDGSDHVFRDLQRLRVPGGWAFGEQELRARLPHQVQILYIADHIQ